MPLDLTKQAIGPEDPKAELPPDLESPLSDIQGNILKSHGRDHSQHLFITFTDVGKAKKWVALMAGRVTSAAKQWKESLNATTSSRRPRNTATPLRGGTNSWRRSPAVSSSTCCSPTRVT